MTWARDEARAGRIADRDRQDPDPGATLRLGALATRVTFTVETRSQGLERSESRPPGFDVQETHD